jgi:hypothetical protein
MTPVNPGKSPTRSSLKTFAIAVSVAAASFLQPLQMTIVSSLGRKQSTEITIF